MKYLNVQAANLYNVTEQDYIDWCTKTKRAPYKQSSKEEFYARLTDGRLVKDKSANKLLTKRPKRRK